MIRFISNLFYILLDLLLILQIKFQELTVKEIPMNWKDGKKGAVILLPGVHSLSHGLRDVGNFLNNNGYKVLTIKELGNNSKPLKECAKILDNFVRHNELKNTILVCHSKGGLIAKYYLDFIDNSKVQRVITLSTPFKGSWMALVLLIFELLPTSKVIKDLNAKKTNNNKFICFYPRIDNIVLPNKNLILENSKNIQIDVVGHTRILVSLQLLSQIMKYL